MKTWRPSRRFLLIACPLAIALIALSVYLLIPRAGYTISSKAATLIPTAQSQLATSLKSSAKSFEYNQGYTASTEVKGESSSPRFSASFAKNPADGVTTIDPTNNVSLTIKPKFSLGAPKASDNRLIYPVNNSTAQVVYSLQVAKVKEDIIINKPQGDKLQFDYEIKLPDGVEARQEDNGSIGIYGVSASLLGTVTTSSDKDAQLLKAARQNGAKTNLLFTLPAPFIKEYGRNSTTARTWFGLKGTELTLYAEGLQNLQYPISIDPTIYIDTAAQLMIGNNESNIDFDVDNGLIEKGKTTGGRFDDWVTNAMPLPSARWNHASAAYGGYMYVMGGSDGSTAKGNLYWAQINSSTGEINAATPGDSSCANWCTSTDYNLPSSATRQGGQLIAYNGYLYYLGGKDAGCTTGNGTGDASNYCKTVYIAKLGANGEPQLWHPSSSDKTTWTYWYRDTDLSSARGYFGAVAYNNKLYLVGGQNAASTNGLATVEKADITPTGVLANWGSVTGLGAGNERYAMGVQTYNDRLYVIGGANGTTTQNTVYYTKINNDGSLNTWLSGSQIQDGGVGGARSSMGGTFTTIWGGYIYVAGGCKTISGTAAAPFCTTGNISNDIQLASINADGSITDWTTVLGVTNTRTSYSLVGWRNRLYAIGGCSSQTVSGSCATPLTTVQYGPINKDGDASTVSTSVANGTAPCASTTYTNCDMPPEGSNSGQGGRMAGGTIINNGFIYYMGGCTAVNSGSVCYTGNAGKASANISYASIANDGSIVRIPTCAGTFAGSWCVISQNGANMGAPLAAFGITVFNNTLYVIGGTDGSNWQSNIWRAPLNANGSWGTWTSQTFAAVGVGAARGYMYSFTRANPTSAATNPGNLYILGGCAVSSTGTAGLDCGINLYSDVYKCNIDTTGAVNSCSTSGQLQIDSEPQTAGTQGLGTMAGTVYANYIYLIGGQSPNEPERGEIMYAKIDNSNNIVAIDGTTTSPWKLAVDTGGSAINLSPVRRRGMAFGYNGYLYALAGYNVSSGGSLNDLLFAKINVSDGSISAFTTSHVTVNARWDLRGAVNNGYVYAMGGCSVGAPPSFCTTMTGTVQTFQLYNNYSGSTKQYAAGTQFATDRYGAGATILNGYIYIAGGCTTVTDCTTATNSVQYASINADGTLGTWQATTGSLPTALTWGKLVTAGGSLYFLGGQTGGSTAGTTNVYWATPSSGNVTSWSTASNQLPAGRTNFGAAVWNNRLYVAGGLDATGSPTSTVYVSPQLNSGGNITSAWDTGGTGFNIDRSGNAVIAYANNLYIFGGATASQYLNDVQYSSLDTTTGRTDAWSYGTSLPSYLYQADAFAANGFMYLIGGRNAATTCRSNTTVAPISANTTIASGNKPTGIGDWYSTNIRYPTDRYGASAVYGEGKGYVLGGNSCGAVITSTNKVQYSTVQSQPQLARYSRMIDTDSDVFPTKWLINGLDNSIGARWYLRYRSMTNPYAPSGQECTTPAMTTWGQEYNYGQITLGSPDIYTPYNGSGTNTNCARFFYLSVSIDSSQAYGYPEDVTRGPTITDLSLFFTADPSKRLMHGRTFTGGLQMPDDTQ